MQHKHAAGEHPKGDSHRVAADATGDEEPAVRVVKVPVIVSPASGTSRAPQLTGDLVALGFSNNSRSAHSDAKALEATGEALAQPESR